MNKECRKLKRREEGILGGFANSLKYVYPQLIIIFSKMGIIRSHLENKRGTKIFFEKCLYIS